MCSKIAHFSFMFFERFALEFAEIAEEQGAKETNNNVIMGFYFVLCSAGGLSFLDIDFFFHFFIFCNQS